MSTCRNSHGARHGKNGLFVARLARDKKYPTINRCIATNKKGRRAADLKLVRRGAEPVGKTDIALAKAIPQLRNLGERMTIGGNVLIPRLADSPGPDRAVAAI